MKENQRNLNFLYETSPQVYQGVAMLYLFAFGDNVHEINFPTKRGSLYEGLLRHLQTAGLIEPKPRNYSELRQNFENLCLQTSEYLERQAKP